MWVILTVQGRYAAHEEYSLCPQKANVKEIASFNLVTAWYVLAERLVIQYNFWV